MKVGTDGVLLGAWARVGHCHHILDMGTGTGILAILDVRASSKGNHRDRVLKALHKYPLVSSIEEVASFIESVKDESYKKEVPQA